MKRFLIAASIAAVLAPSLAAPSYAQDADGRGRGGRGDGQFQPRGDRGGQDGQQRGFGRSDQQRLRGDNPPPVAAPQVAPAPQAQVQRQDRGQFQGGQRPGQFQGRQVQGPGQAQRQDRGQFQGQYQGQYQGQGQRNFDQDRNRGGFDNRQAFQGRNDNRDRFDNRNFQNRRYQGVAPRGGQRFAYQGRDFYRFRTQPYSWPRGFNYNSVRWSLNQLLPSIFFSQSYYIDPYQYGLPWADPGYQWVRVGADALLVDTYTGQIVDIAPGVFYW